MIEFLENNLTSGWTPGAVGVWTLVASCLAMWWKGLPAVLDAFERKQSGIEMRTEALLDAQTKRFNEQLAQADDRHEECMKGQQVLREEVARIQKQYNDLLAIMAQMRQGALAVETVVAGAIRDAREV